MKHLRYPHIHQRSDSVAITKRPSRLSQCSPIEPEEHGTRILWSDYETDGEVGQGLVDDSETAYESSIDSAISEECSQLQSCSSSNGSVDVVVPGTPPMFAGEEVYTSRVPCGHIEVADSQVSSVGSSASQIMPKQDVRLAAACTASEDIFIDPVKVSSASDNRAMFARVRSKSCLVQHRGDRRRARKRAVSFAIPPHLTEHNMSPPLLASPSRRSIDLVKPLVRRPRRSMSLLHKDFSIPTSSAAIRFKRLGMGRSKSLISPAEQPLQTSLSFLGKRKRGLIADCPQVKSCKRTRQDTANNSFQEVRDAWCL